MFIQTDLEHRPGLMAELKVWDAVKRDYSHRENFAVLDYTMYNPGFKGRKQIDILLVDKSIGVTVIEVKGITINQIQSIQGPVWYYQNYYREKGDPYQQAEKQLNMLCNKIEKNPLLFRSFTKRVVIALPYITRKEWEGRGFDKLLHVPPILFKDEIENDIRVLEDYYIVENKEALTERQWFDMKAFFNIKDKNNEIVQNKEVFSRLYVFFNKTQFLEERNYIEQALQIGMKIFLLSYFPLPAKWVKDYQDYREEYQLILVESENSQLLSEKVIIHDGEKLTEHLEATLEKDFPDFNLGQYRASHAPLDNHLMVTAGAGTGKTHVMIDRIMFLLAKGEIPLKDVIMITFTNDSTNEMKERLQKKLIALSKLTGQTKYILYAEDIKEMQISTIHSFARSIIVSLAHELGFGRNVQLRSFVKTKKKIIEELANGYFRTHPLGDLVKLKFRHYELVNVIYDFWEEMEKKGLTKQEIQALDWGKATSAPYDTINAVFTYVFQHCEDRLDIEKKKENAISMGDLIRKLKEFSHDKQKLSQLAGNKFLFVDEFQDSDNVQIEMVASLANFLNYQLFVVGDVKQSIYRFRGADYKSFVLLDEKVDRVQDEESAFLPLSLKHNYRTKTSLLTKLDRLFAEWGKKDWLSYTDDDRLEGIGAAVEKDNEYQFVNVKDANASEAETIASIRESLAATKVMSKDKNRKIALIVRTNAQAKTVKKWCEAADIPTLQNLDGTFYTSDAVRDFKCLLDGLLYPNEAKHVVNALQTPYFRYEIPYHVILPFSGDGKRILDFIHSKIGDDFSRYVEQLKTLPVLAVIQKIISERGILQHLNDFYQKRTTKATQKDFDVEQYKKNLFHLLNIIQQHFETMSGTLFSLHEWLTLQVRTNRTENEPILETTESTVEITTVHRSKGLEYHTVILPKTDDRFERDRTTFYIQEEHQVKLGEKRKVGWYLKKRGNNSHYNQLNKIEKDETNKEETRLLYVAMTRAKERLVVLLPEKNMQDTWSSLIKATGVKEVRNGR